jgi:hypothetical protein
MAHFSQLSQQTLYADYRDIIGHSLTLSITGILIGETVAALSVTLPAQSDTEPPCNVPPSQNTFPHITIWFGEGESASRANELPSLVEKREAVRLELKEPMQISGKFEFWYL